MKIQVKESKKQEAAGLDFSAVEADAKRFDFETLLYNLDEFRKWFDELQDRAGQKIEAPTLHWGSQGSSGFSYNLRTWGEAPVEFDLQCDTHGEFWGTIYVGSQKFIIDDADDLTYGVMNKIVDALPASEE